MVFQIKRFSFEDCYLPINQFLTIDEDTDQIITASPDAIPYPVTDGNILDAVIRYYLTHHRVKQTRVVAKDLKVSSRDLSSTVHLLTGMHHDDFMRKYRLSAMIELLTLTTLSTTLIAKFFGYTSLHVLNQFLVDQTELTANEIRVGLVPKNKQKRGSWYHAADLDMQRVASRNN